MRYQHLLDEMRTFGRETGIYPSLRVRNFEELNDHQILKDYSIYRYQRVKYDSISKKSQLFKV